jgi:hypothetical protein
MGEQRSCVSETVVGRREPRAFASVLAAASVAVAAAVGLGCSGATVTGGGTVSVDAGSAPLPCGSATECPAPANPCEVAVCVGGFCGGTAAPAGTRVPDSVQSRGDCKKLSCGEGGAFATAADTTDLPEDDGNPCTAESCDGPNPTHPNKAAGATCASGDAGAGVCNGSGVCGECTPGSVQCAGNTPRTCEANGTWKNGTPCPFVCSGAGQCTGVCTPGAQDCQGKQPRTCNAAGQWENTGSVCPNVCTAGACTGVCTPGATQCSGNTPQSCNASGQWVSGTACGGTTPACSAGTCVAPLGACASYSYGGGQYFFCTTSPKSWSDAEATCVAGGGHLVTINDANEWSFVNSTLNSGAFVYTGANIPWIGLNDQAVEGTFVWASGQAGYQKWQAGEPQGGRAENCVDFNWDGGQGYRDAACSLLAAFICEVR